MSASSWSQADQQRRDFQAKYLENIASDRWKKLRRFVLNRDRWLCQGCGERKADQVHHRTYIYGFFAPPWTLVSICGQCHCKMHRGWFDNDAPPAANDNNQMELALAAE